MNLYASPIGPRETTSPAAIPLPGRDSEAISPHRQPRRSQIHQARRHHLSRAPHSNGAARRIGSVVRRQTAGVWCRAVTKSDNVSGGGGGGAVAVVVVVVQFSKLGNPIQSNFPNIEIQSNQIFQTWKSNPVKFSEHGKLDV